MLNLYVCECWEWQYVFRKTEIHNFSDLFTQVSQDIVRPLRFKFDFNTRKTYFYIFFFLGSTYMNESWESMYFVHTDAHPHTHVLLLYYVALLPPIFFFSCSTWPEQHILGIAFEATGSYSDSDAVIYILWFEMSYHLKTANMTIWKMRIDRWEFVSPFTLFSSTYVVRNLLIIYSTEQSIVIRSLHKEGDFQVCLLCTNTVPRKNFFDLGLVHGLNICSYDGINCKIRRKVEILKVI